MAISHGDVTESTDFTSADPFNFSHDPSSTSPIGALVFIATRLSTSDDIAAVTYGGTAMSRVEFAQDTAGSEDMAVHAFFLGSGISTGSATVAIDQESTGSGVTHRAVAVTVNGAGNSTVAGSTFTVGAQTNPEVTIDTDTTESLRYAFLASGRGEVNQGPGTDGCADTNAEAGGSNAFDCTDQSFVADHDFGNETMNCWRQTSPSTGSFTLASWQDPDETALVGVALAEAGGTIADLDIASTPSASLSSPLIQIHELEGSIP